MKRKLLISLLLLTSGLLSAQTQNSLSFDGIDDYVSVTNASGLVTGLSEMSITCWVYPTNAAPAYPNFDGFAGFRNDVDADFYLVQVGANSLEARFRNSNGDAFTITSPILTINAWQHIAFTYADGALKLYKNGILVDTASANGTVNNANVDFNIGNVVFQNATFWLTGRMDETSFWSRGLTSSEIRCMPSDGIDTSALGLQLYYKFNQGVASGNNTSITTLIDEKGTIDGTLNGLALNGASSNFIAGYTNAVSTTFGFFCPNTTYTFNGNILTAPGTYTDTLTSSAGCDSIVALQLSQLFVDTSVTVNGFTLTANHTGTFYQWLDCNNGFAPIAGATSKNFTPTAIGSYAVIIFQSTCYDTSSCYNVTAVGLNSFDPNNDVRVYPSITTSNVSVEFNKQMYNVEISLMDLSGKVLFVDRQDRNGKFILDLSNVVNGVYLVKIKTDESIGMYKVLKQ